MKPMDRRNFLRTSALAATSLGMLPMFTGCQTPNAKMPVRTTNFKPRGANEDIRVAVVGFNGRGKDHIEGFSKLKGVRLVALCDVDSKVLERGVQMLKDKKVEVTGYTDIRKLLENKDIDAISVATPNHWHSLAAIWAVQAGKDVYLEKPVSHNVWEGRQLVNAARHYDRIVQTGTQCRSSKGLIEAMAWLHEGNLGKIIRARGLCYKRRASIGKTEGEQKVPDSVDYDLWCGPAPKDPLRRAKLHYDWHWVWPTGNGDLGNQGIHQMDIARWALGEKELSPEVFCFGGRLGYEDDATTPNTLTVVHAYKKAPLIFEVRGLPQKTGTEKMDNMRGASVGVVIDCENGSIVIPSYSKAEVYDDKGRKARTFDASGDHFDNFIKAVRSRKSGDLAADILEGHLSSALCHTGNISYLLGKAASPEKMREKLHGNADALDCLQRMQEHLGVKGVDLAKTPATFGEFLKMDPKAERFTGNNKANQLLTRDYRAPYVVPKILI